MVQPYDLLRRFTVVNKLEFFVSERNTRSRRPPPRREATPPAEQDSLSDSATPDEASSPSARDREVGRERSPRLRSPGFIRDRSTGVRSDAPWSVHASGSRPAPNPRRPNISATTNNSQVLSGWYRTNHQFTVDAGLQILKSE